MIKKKFSKVIAMVLISSMLLPNFQVKAIKNSNDSEAAKPVEDTTGKNDEMKPGTSILDGYEINIQEDIYIEENADNNGNEEFNIDDNKLEQEAYKKEELKEEIKDEAEEDIKEESKEVISEDNIEDVIYEKVKDNNNRVASYRSYSSEEEKFTVSLEDKSNNFKLINKTSKKYEVAMSYEDGTYKFVKAIDNINEGIELAKTVEEIDSDELIVPVIIDENGIIVYSTYSMAKFYQSSGKVINLYKDSNLLKAHTYINDGYVSDAPIINTASNGRVLEVEVSGYNGWVRSNSYGSDYDARVYPITSVTNPSYYYVENGVLKHFISSDMLGTKGKGNSVIIGQAPTYLNAGTQYFSYDGEYFYTSLTTLINDGRSKNNNNAINASSPFYSYNLNLPFRSKTALTANEINKFIESNTSSVSKLRGIGNDLIEAQNKYGVNAGLILGVAINESGWGMSYYAQNRNNLFGIAAVDSNPDNAMSFETPGKAIEYFALEMISNWYSDPSRFVYYGGYLGNKKLGANVKYASDPFWGEKAAAHLYNLDVHASGSRLKEFNSQQLAKFKRETNVIDKTGAIIYEISNLDSYYYGGYIDNTIVISKSSKVSINGSDYYEVYPERDTTFNKLNGNYAFEGIYNWNSKAYVKASDLVLINTKTEWDWKDSWAKVEIEEAMKRGWVEDRYTFRPEDSITRAEFIKIVNKAFGFKSKATSETFDDVTKDQWWYNEVLIALKAGYITNKNATFRPNDKITREEVASIITTIKKNKDTNLDKLKKYKDFDKVSDWAQSSVEGAIEAGYMGVNSDMFNPKQNITRAQSVVTLYRIVNK